jgi:L-threonylcarbamoyladenylate synthase
VAEDLNGAIDMIIDGGDVGIGLESTIVDLTEGTPTILRPGYISQEMLTEVLGQVEMDRGLMSDHAGVRPKAPGMKYRHYAPKASLLIVEGTPEAVRGKINALVKEAEESGGRAGVICTDESLDSYRGGLIKSIGSRKDEISIARHLYSILREYDEEDVSVIYSESFETPQMGQAIMNRLIKAAGHQIIYADESDANG